MDHLVTWHLLLAGEGRAYIFIYFVAVHLGVMMADTLRFTAKVDVVDFWV